MKILALFNLDELKPLHRAVIHAAARTERCAFEMRAAGDEYEMLMYDKIGEGMFSYGVTAKDVAAGLAQAGSQPVHVRLNSPGGDVFQGMAIYNALASHKPGVRVTVDGLAASIASIIAMAGQKCSMAQNSMMMIHNPFCMTSGDAGDLRATADILDKVKGLMVDTYAAKSSTGKRELAQMMDDETWMTAKEAKDAGMCDEVVDPGSAASARATFNIAAFGYKRVPESVAAVNAEETAADHKAAFELARIAADLADIEREREALELQ